MRYVKVLFLGVTLTQAISLLGGNFGGFARQFANLANNPRLRDMVADVGRGIGTIAENVQRQRIEMAKLRKQQHEAYMARLSQRVNDPHLSKLERDLAKRALLEEQEKHTRSNRQQEEFENKFQQSALDLGNELIKGGMQEAFAQAAHGRRLEEVGLEAAQRRKAAVESTKEYIKAFTDPKNITAYVLAAGGVFALYFGMKHGISYIAEHYRKPALADDDKTSLKFGPVNFVKSLIFGTKHEDSAIGDVILEPGLAQEINEITKSLKNIVINGGYFDHLMLWGQPGTGKTMLAMRMARSCGLEYIYFTASNLEPMTTEEASAEVVQLFRYAMSSPRKLMIIIDEAELLLGDRGRADVTDKKRTLLNLILGYTGTESRDYMVTVLTNRPEDIDEAFLSRCGMRIQIGAPAKAERRAIVQSYVDKILIKASNLRPEQVSPLSPKYWFGKTELKAPPAIEEGALSEEALDALAERLDGFVGRDISKLIFRIQAAAFASDDNKITTALINRAVDRALKVKEDEKKGFIRKGTNKGAPKSSHTDQIGNSDVMAAAA